MMVKCSVKSPRKQTASLFQWSVIQWNIGKWTAKYFEKSHNYKLLCGQNADISNVKAHVIFSYHCHLTVKIKFSITFPISVAQLVTKIGYIFLISRNRATCPAGGKSSVHLLRQYIRRARPWTARFWLSGEFTKFGWTFLHILKIFWHLINLVTKCSNKRINKLINKQVTK
jgi:hypothetical protein